jgi:uncharacterized protein (TIGR03067 family)
LQRFVVFPAGPAAELCRSAANNCPYTLWEEIDVQTKSVAWLWLLAVLAGSGGQPAADEPKADTAREELKKLEGTWQVVSIETRQKARPAGEVNGLKLVIKGDTSTFEKDGKPVVGTGKLSIDPSKKPKTVDIAVTGAPEDPTGTFTIPGIYQLDGDSLRICWGGPKRPTEFKTTPDGGDLLVLTRDKP